MIDMDEKVLYRDDLMRIADNREYVTIRHHIFRTRTGILRHVKDPFEEPDIFILDAIEGEYHNEIGHGNRIAYLGEWYRVDLKGKRKG